MKNKYFFGIFLAIIVLTVNQGFIQYWLYQKNQDARIINLAGRQRMLSQKVLAQYLLFEDRKIDKINLKNTFDEWEKSHLILMNGNQYFKPVNDESAKLLLNDSYKNILLSKKLINDYFPNDATKFLQNQNSFLQKMDNTVKLLVAESDKKLKFIVFIEILLAIVSIIIIALEVIYIYSPIEKKLNNVITKLSYSENMLSILYESTHDACIFIDNNYQFRYFNNVAELFYQSLNLEKPIIGQNFHIDNIDIDFDNYFKKCDNGEKSSFEKRINNNFWLFTIYPVYDKSNIIVGKAVNIQNISDIKSNELKAKETEKRLEIITSNFPYGSISLIDKNLNFLYTGGLGYKEHKINPSDLIGKPLNTVISKEIFDEMSNRLSNVWSGKVESYQVEFSDKIYLNTLQPIANEIGNIDSFVIIVMDVTERVKNEEEIKKQNYKLKAIAWQQSHELRRPIANLIGLIELLKEDPNLSKNEYLPLIDKSVQDIDLVIDKIMGYT